MALVVNMGCYSSKVFISSYFIKTLTNTSVWALNIILLGRYLSRLFHYYDALPVSHFVNVSEVITAIIFMRVRRVWACGRDKVGAFCISII